LGQYDDLEILQKKAPEILKKYSQEQAIQKLLQKGFRMNDIYTVLRRR
jgi:SOS response regulatory protein OraA/RecX